MNLIRILYLEDDDDCIELVRTSLQHTSQAYQLEDVDSVEQARELVRSHQFDVVIADYNLRAGTESGSAFLQELIAQGYHVPLILTSAQEYATFDKPTRLMIHQGNLLYIEKSYLTSGQLEHTLAYLLGRRMHVLCIDDDPEDSTFMAHLLADAAPYRFSVSQVHAIEDAVRQLTEREWDVVLIDWMLDPANRETAEEVLDSLLEKTRNMTVVVLSGYSTELLSEHAIRIFGRRAVAWCSKQKLTSRKLVQAIMMQKNRLANAGKIADLQ